MKKQFFLAVTGLFFLSSLSSCLWRNHNTSISISDDEDEYQMTASYEKKKAHRVQQFLNRCLEHNNYTSFGNTRVDATITLDDRTTFYMRSFPGKLKIKLDKTENSEESYYKMKDICEDIKNILAENKEEDR